MPCTRVLQVSPGEEEVELSSSDDEQVPAAEQRAAPQADQGDGLASNSMASTNSSVSVLAPSAAPAAVPESVPRCEDGADADGVQANLQWSM